MRVDFPAFDVWEKRALPPVLFGCIGCIPRLEELGGRLACGPGENAEVLNEVDGIGLAPRPLPPGRGIWDTPPLVTGIEAIFGEDGNDCVCCVTDATTVIDAAEGLAIRGVCGTRLVLYGFV